MKQAHSRVTRAIKQPPRNRKAQREEYWRERAGIVICPSCGNVHYKKRWWHNDDQGLRKLVVLDYRKAAHTRCPACAMVGKHLYEGELMVEDIPSKFRKDLAQLLKHFGKTATEIDPQDRIIAVERKGGTWRITTTENQLADRLAKKIRESLKKHAHVHISHSKEPYEVDRVRVTFTHAA